jgi:two-component system NtrC family sensor kinase
VIADPRISAARQLILELSAATSALPNTTVADVLAGLEAVAREAECSRETDLRVRELVDSLYALASLDFSKPPTFRDDGSPMDAAAGCVLMMSEELAAYVEERGRIEQHLEARVGERTAELVHANESLRREVIERTRAQETLYAREAQLVQASKMAAVGQLAAGIAHEINNPLAIILGFAQGLERRLPEAGEQFRKPIASIVREALRCRNLVQELLTFSRTGNRSREPLDLLVVLQSARHLLESRARTQDTQVHFVVSDKGPWVEGNKTQLEQVLINLGNNALDALKAGGELVLRIAPVSDTHVIVEVEDTGPGIPEDIQGRIFEPFFTTKEVGKGTGLGLSLAYEIVQQHGGTLDVRSALGRGTTMTIRLPVIAPRQAVLAS